MDIVIPSQVSLDFSRPLSRRSDPESSKRAERAIRESGAGRAQAAQLLAAIKRHPGMSTKQIAQIENMDRYMCGRRASTLFQNGLVIRGESKGQELRFWAVLESEIK